MYLGQFYSNELSFTTNHDEGSTMPIKTFPNKDYASAVAQELNEAPGFDRAYEWRTFQLMMDDKFAVALYTGNQLVSFWQG